jgi:hypothetical protein
LLPDSADVDSHPAIADGDAEAAFGGQQAASEKAARHEQP